MPRPAAEKERWLKASPKARNKIKKGTNQIIEGSDREELHLMKQMFNEKKKRIYKKYEGQKDLEKIKLKK